jgi:hypothetical protein
MSLSHEHKGLTDIKDPNLIARCIQTSNPRLRFIIFRIQALAHAFSSVGKVVEEIVHAACFICCVVAPFSLAVARLVLKI